MRGVARLCEDLCVDAIVVAIEQPRLLHRRSEVGYTRVAMLAMSLEPEAVSEDDQWLLAKAARDRELRTWLTIRQRMLGEIEHLRAHVHDPHVDRAARALQREITALDRKLTG